MSYERTKIVDGSIFAELVNAGVACLNENAKTVNDLNVFPIPDGDTGDNMLHTISGGLKAMNAADERDIGAKARALADGMLLNARGNSGVILSQLFAGLAKGLSDLEEANIKQFAAAFCEGVKTAYLSVVSPVEGTILTVARESFESAADKVTDNTDLAEYFGVVLEEMKVSLENTPNLLAVLKEAGVIDSGGAGLVTSAQDYIRFLDALQGGRIVSKANFTQMCARSINDVQQRDFNWPQMKGYSYGLGLRVPLAGSGLSDVGWGGAAGAYALMEPASSVSMCFFTSVLGTDEVYLYSSLRDALKRCTL